MGEKITPYEKKKLRRLVDWEWLKFCALRRKTIEVPILGTVAAGRPILAVPNWRVISVPRDMVGRFETYALQVDGDSMAEDNIQDGDIIVIEARETAANGETVVAMINNEEVTLKKLYVEPDHIRLQPACSEMKTIIIRNHDIKILGVVSGVIRTYRR